MPRDKIVLACEACKERNYNKTKNKRLHSERVEYRKYCPRFECSRLFLVLL
jgi:large subunit ribosomal protein L33